MKCDTLNVAGTHLARATHGVPPASQCDALNVAGTHLARATHGVPPASRTPLQ